MTGARTQRSGLGACWLPHCQPTSELGCPVNEGTAPYLSPFLRELRELP